MTTDAEIIEAMARAGLTGTAYDYITPVEQERMLELAIDAMTKAFAICAPAIRAQAQAQIEALRNVVEAWESLPGGRHYGPKTVEAWLCGAMKRAVDDARAALKEPSHDD